MGDLTERRAAQEFLMDAFKRICTERHLPGWIEREQVAMAIAANQWAEAHGLARRVTRDDVVRIEVPALGHIDYSSKLCLYLVEWMYEEADHG